MCTYASYACKCVWACVCVSCLEQHSTSINYNVKPRLPWSSQASPGYSSSSPCAPPQPEHCFTLQGFRRDHVSFVKFFCPPSFYSFHSVHFLSLPISLRSPRPPGCSLSKPIVSMHITNKLCSSKGYIAHFCLATHCCSIISCYHDIASLKPSTLGGKK